MIRSIDFKNDCMEKNLEKLFSILGENAYLDRYIVDCILNDMDKITNQILERVMEEIILKREYNNEKIYHIIDLGIELNLDVVKDADITFILEKYKLDFDIISILIEYIEKFESHISEIKVYELLEFDYPENIKVQILTLFFNFNGIKDLEKYIENSNTITQYNKEFYNNYIKFLKGDFLFKGKKLTILQSMFYGDFEDSGKGNNGGLAILLKNLGDEISKDSRISYVFTITITEDLSKPFISYYGDKHIFIRLPIYLNKEKSDPFVKKELIIKRYIKNFLEKIEIYPDIFHIRYLDNASKAVGNLSKELDKKLVFTLAPDPHRNMSNNSNGEEIELDQLVAKLNKIKIGDQLIYESDAIVGIGNEKVRKELEIYFPHFKEKDIRKKVAMIGEGIRTELKNEEKTNLKQFIKLNGMDPDFFEKPIILNVGRLSIQKGQIQLLKAWKDSELSKTHNLLMIGGDVEKPSKEEKKVIGFFKEYEKLNPERASRFFHKSAMINEDIRSLQISIMEKELDYPHLYISSSIKEEFGIAILEAMSQGFLVFGPIKGGVKSYLVNGVNGFLIDTKNSHTIAEGTVTCIYDEKRSKEEFKEIQNKGKRTVEELFSIETIGSEFLEFYLALRGEVKDEI